MQTSNWYRFCKLNFKTVQNAFHEGHDCPFLILVDIVVSQSGNAHSYEYIKPETELADLVNHNRGTMHYLLCVYILFHVLFFTLL